MMRPYMNTPERPLASIRKWVPPPNPNPPPPPPPPPKGGAVLVITLREGNEYFSRHAETSPVNPLYEIGGAPLLMRIFFDEGNGNAFLLTPPLLESPFRWNILFCLTPWYFPPRQFHEP